MLVRGNAYNYVTTREALLWDIVLFACAILYSLKESLSTGQCALNTKIAS